MSISNRRRAILLPVIVAAGIALMYGSSPGSSAPVDGDGDGWFDAASNAAMDLTLVSATLPASLAPGGFEILVDEVRFPLSPLLNGRFPQPFGAGTTATTTIGTLVATRVRGVAGLGATGTPFAVTVQVIHHGPILGVVTEAPPMRVRFSETSGALPSTAIVVPGVGTVTLAFSVATSSFADPTPSSATADADNDAMPEATEAQLSAAFGGIFDPRAGSPRDIDVIVGSTTASYRLSQTTRADLRSRFIQQGFRMHIDTGFLNGMTGAGGVMNLAGTGAALPPADVIDSPQLTAIRSANIPASRRPTSHLVLLATAVTDGTPRTLFGFALGPAVVFRTNVPIVGETPQYQKGLIMHELGHAFGLCHSQFQDGVTATSENSRMCPPPTCGAVPPAERTGNASVMGSPVDDPNFVIAGWNALSRPDDYSNAQWPMITLGCALAP